KLSTSQFQCDDAMPGSVPTRNDTPRPARARCASAQPSPPDTSLPGHRSQLGRPGRAALGLVARVRGTMRSGSTPPVPTDPGKLYQNQIHVVPSEPGDDDGP